MTDYRRSVLEAILPRITLRHSKLLPSEEKIGWLPVLLCHEPDLYMGLMDDGSWVFEGRSGLHLLSEPRSFFRVIVLLEQPINVIKEKIIDFFKDLDIIIDFDELFPSFEIVRAGLEEQRPYWSELAFKWYDELNLEKQKKLKDSLVIVENSRVITQSLRYRARKELRKLNRSEF
ncbi:hypothetical protein Desaci_1990 [Desulfosporosinus acidiphilus SJ4]|uniref:Uncharacterized protein n=1 Tax=Desulfosporosinus acidiphilus (strain DSM 22704 / JCM 16185 / SJ4) TaxID=646529 RepID=I4D591_DESAJ|nr:hypothetical protein [Desulfosporosinus acidiphilus]AFM40965.1 hypothetical protein Desaci_1990 [Desulfosporosinus acidiphilus SJ4]